MSLPTKIVELHQALETAQLPHAFGGALALAWCTGQARGTIDIDVNIFVDAARLAEVIAGLPTPVTCSQEQRSALKRDGQVRLWWDHTPVDVFLNTTPFHEQVAQRVQWESFAGQSVPFLCCNDLAVFKAFFNRGKDWVDIEEMCRAGTVNLDQVTEVIQQYLGCDDDRVVRLVGMTQS